MKEVVMSDVSNKISKMLSDNKVVLFMKGSPQAPMCGFSARATAILDDLGVPFFAVDVLQSPEIREGIKAYGNWPTIPQLYVDQQLVGGSDIMMEMYNAGELQALLKSSHS